MYIEYKIVEMPVVNVELENFGKASYKVPQGSSTTITLTPSKDWKVATVSLNGKDVTADVKDGVYTLKEVTAESDIIATFRICGGSRAHRDHRHRGNGREKYNRHQQRGKHRHQRSCRG